MEGEAVFYGPKIDIKVRDALGRLWQCTTIQFDFNMSARFGLAYIGEDGKEHQPYMVHRALLGSLERFFGVLIEHYNGNFPLWLAPVQVEVVPIADRHDAYARSLEARTNGRGLRAHADLRREKVNYKIREAERAKVPLILVVGDKEVASGQASLRVHGQGDKGPVDVEAFLTETRRLNDTRSLSLTF
jgi:threonyl-tRNA synthetase